MRSRPHPLRGLPHKVTPSPYCVRLPFVYISFICLMWKSDSIFLYIHIFNGKCVIHCYIKLISLHQSDTFMQYLPLYSRMTSTNLKYSESYPKCLDITGSCEEAFGLGTDLQTTIINSLRANTVVAIRIVSFWSLETQFIFNPQVYTKPNGTPIAILGNASNKMG